MAQATRLRLEAGERRVLVVRRHWWLLARSTLGLLLMLAVLPAYAAVEYVMPQADLARYAGLFLTIDLLLCAVLALKWLAVDFASWYADRYVITNHRVIEQQGVVTVLRREASLRAIQESNYTISGAEARFFDYGDLRVQTGGRGKAIIFRQVPHPRRIQTLLSAHARAAREEQRQRQGGKNEISAALTRIFDGVPDAHDAPTQVVPRISTHAARAQRRLNLLHGETVLHATRRHPLLLLQGLAPPLAWACAGILAHALLHPPVSAGIVSGATALLTLWALWAFWDWRDDLYVLTTDRIMELRRTPLFFELRNVVQLRAVRDVVLRIGSLGGRLCNLGALTVEIGDADPLELAGVPHPDRVQRAIFEAIDAATQRDALREQERLAGTLTEWFEEYHRMQSQP